MAVLAWVPREKVFLKVQQGTGDNLSREDMKQGFVDYVLWSTFRPESIDVDGELEMCPLDGGMVMFRQALRRDSFEAEALGGSYRQAFNRTFAAGDVIVLMNDNDEGDGKSSEGSVPGEDWRQMRSL